MSEKPNAGQCSLCNVSINGNAVWEARASGKDGRIQRWPYCPRCWSAQSDAEIDEVLLANRLLAFLRWILAGYRLERRPGAGGVYRIVPKKRIDLRNDVMLEIPHANTSSEDERRTPQEVQAGLCPSGHGNERAYPEMDSGLCGEGRKETEEINPHGAGPEAVSAATGP